MLDLLGLLLNAYNITVGLLVLISSVMDLFRFFSFEAVMVDLYVIAAGLMILTLETVGSAKVVEYVPIMKQWLGRGILYILLGVLCLGHFVDEKSVFPLVVGVIVIILGSFALFFHFGRLQMSIPLVVNLRGEQVRFDSLRKEEDEAFIEEYNDM